MIEKAKSRQIEQKKKLEYSIIRPSANIPEKTVIKDNIKIVSFLNPLSFKTQKRYKEVIRSFFNFYDGFKISDIESHHVEYHLTHNFKDMSDATKALHKSVLSSLFKFLVKDCYITIDPTFALKKVKVDKTKFLNRIPELDGQHILTNIPIEHRVNHPFYANYNGETWAEIDWSLGSYKSLLGN